MGSRGAKPQAENGFNRIETPSEAYPENYFADSSLGLDLYFNQGINCLVIIINQKKFELNFLHFLIWSILHFDLKIRYPLFLLITTRICNKTTHKKSLLDQIRSEFYLRKSNQSEFFIRKFKVIVNWFLLIYYYYTKYERDMVVSQEPAMGFPQKIIFHSRHWKVSEFDFMPQLPLVTQNDCGISAAVWRVFILLVRHFQ